MKNGKSTTRNFCDETERLIDEYLSGDISSKDKEIMEAHIAVCEDCRNYLDATSKLKLRLGTLSTNYSYLSSSDKDRLWEKIDSGIDFDKAKTEASENHRISDYSNKGIFHRFRYVGFAFAAIAVIAVIYFAVTNLKIGNQTLTKQDAFGFPSYWKVSSLSGTPLISDEAMAKLDSIRDGEFIITNDTSRAELFVADIGKIIVEPNTKLMIVKGEDGKNKISVVYGTIDAEMKTSPDPVSLELPSAVATDAGGSYKLTVDQAGDGLFFVKSGQVEVISGNKQSVVPAGNLVITKKDKGVGTPFSVNSSSVLKKALYEYDFGTCDDKCVTTIVNAANNSDAVTLVNMIPQVDENMKNLIFNKAVVIAPPPPTVPGDSLKHFDAKNIEEWVHKIQVEIDANIERNIRDIEKSLENLKALDTIPIERFNWHENYGKHFKVKVIPEGDFDFEFNFDSSEVYFDKEEFKREMDVLKQDLKEDLQDRKEEVKENMEELKIELKELEKDLKEEEVQRNKELKRELEEAQKEMKKALEEVNKNMNIEIHTGPDGEVKVKVKDNEHHEIPEVPEAPEVPENEGDK